MLYWIEKSGAFWSVLLACLLTVCRCSLQFEEKAEGSRISEVEIADISGYIVFVAPLVWDSLVFISYTRKDPSYKTLGKSKEIVLENIKRLKEIIKNKELFRTEINNLLSMYERGYIEGDRARNSLFNGIGEALQEEEMQKRSIEPVRRKISKLSRLAEKILRENIQKLIKTVEKKKDKEIWTMYQNVISKAHAAMQENTSVKNSLDITIKEFNTKIQHILLEKETDQIAFNMEKARFNLGGAIYAPGLALQILSQITSKDKDFFIGKVMESVLNPVLSLRSKIAGYTPENIKEETIKYLKTVTGLIEVYSLKKQITDAQDIRSESIYRIIKKILNKKALSHKIDSIQMKRTQRMMKVLQEANPSLFANFITIDRSTASKYTEYIRTGGGNKKLRQEIEDFFDLD